MTLESNNLIQRFLQPDQQRLKVQKEANQLRMGKDTDEREDFLYQIRTKVCSHVIISTI